MKTWEILVSIFSLPLITSVITVFLNNVLNKKKNTAEVDNIVSKTYEGLLKSCLQEIERLKIRFDEQELESVETREQNKLIKEENQKIRIENQLLREEIASLKKIIEDLTLTQKK